MKRKFKVRHCLLAANAWEVVQKLIEAVSGSKVLHENFNRDAGAFKYEGTVHDFGITRDNLLTLHRVTFARDRLSKTGSGKERYHRRIRPLGPVRMHNGGALPQSAMKTYEGSTGGATD